MSSKPEVLTPVSGFAPRIALCLAAMEEVRGQLREAVQGLSDERLAQRIVPGSHSIGALVLHIGEGEWWWMHCIVGGNAMTDADKTASYWDVLEKEDAGEDFAARGLSAKECLAIIDAIRIDVTHRVLSAMSDADLGRIISFKSRSGEREVELRWVLHHLVDHEAQHKGQILMIKRLLG